MATARDHLALAPLGGLLFSTGGRLNTPSDNLSAHEAYDPTSDTWSLRAALPTPRSGVATAVLNGWMLVVGGERTGGVFDTNEAYDRSPDAWTTLQRLPSDRHGTGAGVIDGVAYMPGGPVNGGSLQLDDNLAFALGSPVQEGAGVGPEQAGRRCGRVGPGPFVFQMDPLPKEEAIVTDLQTLVTGLVVGESPRWHDDRLWFANWGAQEVVAVDAGGRTEVVLHVSTTVPLSIDWLPDRRLLLVSGPEARLLSPTGCKSDWISRSRWTMCWASVCGVRFTPCSCARTRSPSPRPARSGSPARPATAAPRSCHGLAHQAPRPGRAPEARAEFTGGTHRHARRPGG
jgi:hypothetical protein